MHRARKAEKRLRYAAELVDKRMKRMARKAKKLQTLLGEHQDAVVAANFLATISAPSDGENGESGFTYGVLVANELNRAAEIRESKELAAQPFPRQAEPDTPNHQAEARRPAPVRDAIPVAPGRHGRTIGAGHDSSRSSPPRRRYAAMAP